MEHYLSRYLNKQNPCLGFGKFQQKLCEGQAWQVAAGNGRAAVSLGRQRDEGGGGDVHAVLELKCWQLLSLAWLHREARRGKAELSQSEWG